MKIEDIDKQIAELKEKKKQILEEEKKAKEKVKEERYSEALKAYEVIKQYIKDYGEFKVDGDNETFVFKSNNPSLKFLKDWENWF